MFKRLRIAVLLYVLAFVAIGSYLTSAGMTDWDSPLWVDVYPVNGDGTATTQNFIDRLEAPEFEAIESFFASQAEHFGVEIARPFRLNLAPQLTESVPEPPDSGSVLDALVWSMKMRWMGTRLNWDSDRPTPDIVILAVFHDPDETPVLERSAALKKGLIVVANLFADRSARGSNHVVIAHELLHTLGASDKYDPANNFPSFPDGFADPGRTPLYPQKQAELMGGRIPIAEGRAEIPASLNRVRVGPLTAAEIGWLTE